MEAKLTPEQRASLLAMARAELDALLGAAPPKRLPEEGEPFAATPRACFVTLYDRDGLRGCIGTLEADAPLAFAVRSMTRAAAVRDPRFPPLTPEELPHVRISLSVLSPSVGIHDPLEIKVGTHGLCVRRGNASGVLLPQVAAERGWDRVRFLDETCRKAGLPSDAWQRPDTHVEVFAAEVFGEDERRSTR
jgi:AmmeMemoRadiSam system protein A